MAVALCVENLVKEYLTPRGQPRKVLNGACLQVQHGEVVGLAGRNGTGKTTLLRCIANTVSPDSGVVSTNGAVSLLLDGTKSLYRHLSAWENLRYLAVLHGVSRVDTSIQDVLTRLNITYADAPVNTYSRGMMQRVALAAALLSSPTVLLLDEPSTALDSETADELAHVIREMAEKRGMAVLIASHDRPFLKRCANRFLHLADGKVFQTGDDLSGLWDQVVLRLTLDHYSSNRPIPDGVFIELRGAAVHAWGVATPDFLRWAAAAMEEGSVMVACSVSMDQGRGQAGDLHQTRAGRSVTNLVGASPTQSGISVESG